MAKTIVQDESAGGEDGTTDEREGRSADDPAPGLYEHYKGSRYRVIDHVRHSETEETLVLYRALYGDYGLWVRPLSMFNESAEIGGRKLPRFRRIGD